MRAERRRLRAADRRHAEHLRHGRHAIVHAGLAMGAQHHAHFLQHVAVVVDAGLVETNRGVDPLRLEPVEGRDAAAQAKIRAAIVADVRAGLGEPVEVAFGEPDAVSERHLWSEQAEPADIIDRGAAAATSRIFLLICGLDEVHMERHAMLFGAFRQHGQRLVRTPMQVRRRQLDFDALLVVVLGVKVLEQFDRILGGQLKTAEMLRQQRADVVRTRARGIARSPRRRDGSGRAARSNTRPACRCPRRRGSRPRSALRPQPACRASSRGYAAPW